MLTAVIRSNVDSSTFSMSPLRWVKPALLTMMSTRPKSSSATLSHLVELGLLRDVRRDGDRGLAELPRHTLRCFRVEVGDDDLRALLGEAPRHRLAETGRRAGDDRHLVFEAAHLEPPSKDVCAPRCPPLSCRTSPPQGGRLAFSIDGAFPETSAIREAKDDSQSPPLRGRCPTGQRGATGPPATPMVSAAPRPSTMGRARVGSSRSAPEPSTAGPAERPTAV